MKFKSQHVLTGILQRVSAKTGKPYTICNFLNEEGVSFSAMYKGADLIPGEFKQMDIVDVTFNLRTGAYMNLEVLELVQA